MLSNRWEKGETEAESAPSSFAALRCGRVQKVAASEALPPGLLPCWGLGMCPHWCGLHWLRAENVLVLKVSGLVEEQP